MLKLFIFPSFRVFSFTNHLPEVINKYHLFIHLSICALLSSPLPIDRQALVGGGEQKGLKSVLN